jgi:two-component system chemotaxis response regulator CheY
MPDSSLPPQSSTIDQAGAPSPAQGETQAPLNILVVDDSAVMRTMVIRALKMTGLSVGEIFQAANGMEALARLDEHWIDFVTVDIHMSGMNGTELIERLRATPETAALPIIVISSEGSETRIQEIEERGAVFLRKPFEPESLRQVVLRALKIDDAS